MCRYVSIVGYRHRRRRYGCIIITCVRTYHTGVRDHYNTRRLNGCIELLLRSFNSIWTELAANIDHFLVLFVKISLGSFQHYFLSLSVAKLGRCSVRRNNIESLRRTNICMSAAFRFVNLNHAPMRLYDQRRLLRVRRQRINDGHVDAEAN